MNKLIQAAKHLLLIADGNGDGSLESVKLAPKTREQLDRAIADAEEREILMAELHHALKMTAPFAWQGSDYRKRADAVLDKMKERK
jgi:hypothetical protein